MASRLLMHVDVMSNLFSKFSLLPLLAVFPACFVPEHDHDADVADTEDAEDDDSDAPDRDTADSGSNPMSATGADSGDDEGESDDDGSASMTGPVSDGSSGGSDDGDASATDDGDTGSTGDGEELLVNGSFEAWSGGTPDAWSYGDATLEEVVGDAADGERAVRVSSSVYNFVGQYIDAPLAAGSCLDLAVAVRWESGSAQAPMVLLQGTDEAFNDVQMFVELDWSADGQWRTTTGSVMNAEAWTSFSFNVLSNDSVAQVFTVDDASLQLVPCP